MKTIAIIPARAGHYKNFRAFHQGKSLVQRTLDEATKSHCFERVIISSDAPVDLTGIEEAEGARHVPRPAMAATAEASMQDAVIATTEAEQIDPDTRIVLLYPIYPFRSHVDIRWIAEVTDGRDNPCIGITEQREHPSLAVWGDTLTPVAERLAYRRQDMRPCYRLTHWLSVFKVKHLADMDNNLTQPAEHIRVPVERTLDIDTWHDWQVAQALLETRREP